MTRCELCGYVVTTVLEADLLNQLQQLQRENAILKAELRKPSTSLFWTAAIEAERKRKE